jgi:hypothetical protein
MVREKFFCDNLNVNLNISNYYIKPSRDIFEEAWLKRDDKVKNKILFRMKNKIKIAAITVCIMAFCFSALLIIVPDSRTFAVNTIKSIFVLEKVDNNYKVVEKADNVPLDYVNIGGINVDKYNKKLVEKRLGFSFYLPEKIGQTIKLNFLPQLGIVAYKIKVGDIAVSTDKLMKAVKNDTIFKELTNSKVKFYIGGIYSDLKHNTYYLSISKDNREINKTIISVRTIENVKCKVAEVQLAVYPTIRNGRYISDDLSKKPIKTIKARYLLWNFKGINYKVTSPQENLKLENLSNFSKEYIKLLKLNQ